MTTAPSLPRSATQGSHEETDEEIAAWKTLKKWMRGDENRDEILEGQTFKLRGQIQKFIFDEGDRWFVEERVDQKTKKKKDWYFCKVVVQITDSRLGTHGRTGVLTLPPKKVGASFFDGYVKNASRLTSRGGMYNVHYAVTHAEPSPEMVKNNGPWTTDDYEAKPIMLDIIYLGKTEEDSAYYGQRANLQLFLNGFERDPKVAKRADDDDDDAPVKRTAAVAADDDEVI